MATVDINCLYFAKQEERTTKNFPFSFLWNALQIEMCELKSFIHIVCCQPTLFCFSVALGKPNAYYVMDLEQCYCCAGFQLAQICKASVVSKQSINVRNAKHVCNYVCLHVPTVMKKTANGHKYFCQSQLLLQHWGQRKSRVFIPEQLMDINHFTLK